MVRGILLILILSVFMLSIAQDYKRAPNSYIYDINYAEVYQYGGLQIPVIKAYHAWNDANGFLNQPIPNGVQSAYVYWEDVPGLIRQVEISGTNESANINVAIDSRSEEHTSELQSRGHLVCRLLLDKKKQN